MGIHSRVAVAWAAEQRVGVDVRDRDLARAVLGVITASGRVERGADFGVREERATAKARPPAAAVVPCGAEVEQQDGPPPVLDPRQLRGVVVGLVAQVLGIGGRDVERREGARGAVRAGRRWLGDDRPACHRSAAVGRGDPDPMPPGAKATPPEFELKGRRPRA